MIKESIGIISPEKAKEESKLNEEQIKKADKWIPPNGKKLVELYEEMPEALKSNDLDKIKKILHNPKNVQGLLLDRSSKGKNLINLRTGLDFFFAEEFGPQEDISSIESEKIVEWV